MKNVNRIIVLMLVLTGLPVMTAQAQRVPGADQSSKSFASDATAKSKEEKYARFLKDYGAEIGRKPIALRDQATLDLPEGFAFIPQKPGAEIMERMGNKTDSSFVGLIFPDKPDEWFFTVEYNPSGYIKDDDARTWDADKLLDEIRTNTEEHNKELAQQGMPGLEVIGWVEKPKYDETTHKLVWSISAKEKGTTAHEHLIINYKTMVLGRKGYIDMTLVTNMDDVEKQKPMASLLLSKLDFTSGKRYADFNASTDHVAEYGLAALVAGVAAKKLGLFAVAAAFLAKFAKIGIITAIAFFAALRKRMGIAKKKETGPPQLDAQNNAADKDQGQGNPPA